MFQKRLRWLIALVAVIYAHNVFPQIVASTTSGCAPLSVQFSGPSGATNVLWNLGGALGTSTLSSPNPIYSNPGTYLVTYTAMVNNSPVSYSITIQVNPIPSAGFSYVLPPTRCAPLTATFIASGGSPGSTYSWAYGDLNVSANAGATITHVYGAGTFSPVMIMADASTGCTVLATSQSPVQLNVSSPPQINIMSSNGFVGCTSPFTTNITGSTSVSGSPNPGPLSFNWSFVTANPPSSSLATPGSISFQGGSSVISLTVTDNNMCSNNVTMPVWVGAPMVTATIQPTVCVNTMIYPQVLSTQAITNWTFSGQGTSTGVVAPGVITTVSPGIMYTSGGLKSYTVSISNGVCPPTSYTNTFFVEEIVADFTISPSVPHSTCSPVFTVSYINLTTSNSGSPLTYIWSSTSGQVPGNQIAPASTTLTTPASPVFTMSQNNNNPYTIYQEFLSFVTLKVQSPQCSSDVVIHVGYDTLQRPTAWFNKDKKEGCAPLAVTFRDSSFYHPNFAINGYTLYNGANPTTSVSGTSPTVFPVTFTYAMPGVYTPSLHVESVGGCIDISFVDTIIVTSPPTVSASISQATACAGQPVTINMSATASPVPGSTSIPNVNYIQHWHVTTDNGFFSGCVSNPNPTFPFTHIGTHTIGVSAYHLSCAGSATLPQTIVIKGPYGKFRYKTTCIGNKNDVEFRVFLQDVQTATLNFGDNTTQTFNGNVGATASYTASHTYTPAGTGGADYTVTLTSANPLNTLCSNKTFTQAVSVRHPDANILFAGQPIPALPNAMSCTGMRYNFSGSTSVDAEVGCGIGYLWQLKTPNYTMPSFRNNLSNFGGPLGAYHNPTAGFPLDTTVFDLTSRDTFRLAGTYTVSLTIKDVNGCMDTETKVFRISTVKPSFTVTPNPLCLSNGQMQVTSFAQQGTDTLTSYLWNFGDGSMPTAPSPTLANPSHLYTYAFSPFQIFAVKCVVTNTVGCKDSAIVNLKVSNPDVNVGVSNNFPCLPLGQSTVVSFTASSGFSSYSLSYGDPPVSPSWVNLSSFGVQSHSYNYPGAYNATVIATDGFGCKGSDSVKVNVIGQPTASITYSPNSNRLCLNDIVNIVSNSSIHVNPISSYFFSIPTQSATISNTTGFIPFIGGTGVHVVHLYVNVQGYCYSSVVDTIYVGDPKATPLTNKKTFCLGDTINVSGENMNGVYGLQWFFGDNVPQMPSASSPTATSSPTINYPYIIYPTTANPGQTTLTLKYYGIGGSCPRYGFIDLNVIKLDADFIQSDNLYRHCLGISDRFDDKTPNYHSLSYYYNWDFGTIGSSSSQSPVITFSNPGVWPVKMNVEDSKYHCKASAVKNMTILALPRASLLVPDTACMNAAFTVTGSGIPAESNSAGFTGTLVPGGVPLAFNPQNTFTSSTSAAVSSIFSLSVTDNNGCVSTAVTDFIFIQGPAISKNWDTVVVIGQPIPLNSFVGSNFSYTWTPVTTSLNCLNCYNPVSQSTNDITYTVAIQDILPGCFITPSTYNIKILPVSSIDMPTAFNPTGYNENRSIRPEGWGLRKLNYFKVFNRWGQLLFETNELKVGWDGTFNGVPQNMETYVYQVSAETYLNETLTKTGTFTLIR